MRAHPRSRGENLGAVRGRALRRWLIPAHAGKTLAGGVVQDELGAHPRSRGENHLLGPRGRLRRGSSPLTRGKLTLLVSGDHPPGLIPAHAGKTIPGVSSRRRGWAHPRSRGENVDECVYRERGLGSSPLTRGKHGGRWPRGGRGRLIPAHAGKTSTALSAASSRRAHPRSRGENP